MTLRFQLLDGSVDGHGNLVVQHIGRRSQSNQSWPAGSDLGLILSMRIAQQGGTDQRRVSRENFQFDIFFTFLESFDQFLGDLGVDFSQQLASALNNGINEFNGTFSDLPAGVVIIIRVNFLVFKSRPFTTVIHFFIIIVSIIGVIRDKFSGQIQDISDMFGDFSRASLDQTLECVQDNFNQLVIFIRIRIINILFHLAVGEKQRNNGVQMVAQLVTNSSGDRTDSQHVGMNIILRLGRSQSVNEHSNQNVE
mmetsp:Transcript_23204/g.26303  ORF Transcript_23204/g.26303 Transcript_23204/m.26303 type:complete len:252 (+) Transcript_23204:1967-2722(+)